MDSGHTWQGGYLISLQYCLGFHWRSFWKYSPRPSHQFFHLLCLPSYRKFVTELSTVLGDPPWPWQELAWQMTPPRCSRGGLGPWPWCLGSPRPGRLGRSRRRMPRVFLTSRSGPDGKAQLSLFSTGRWDLLALGHCRRLLKSSGMVDSSIQISSQVYSFTTWRSQSWGISWAWIWRKKIRRHKNFQ